MNLFLSCYNLSSEEAGWLLLTRSGISVKVRLENGMGCKSAIKSTDLSPAAIIHSSEVSVSSVPTSASSRSDKCANPFTGCETCTHTLCRSLEIRLHWACPLTFTAQGPALIMQYERRFYRTWKHKLAEIGWNWILKKPLSYATLERPPRGIQHEQNDYE